MRVPRDCGKQSGALADLLGVDMQKTTAERFWPKVEKTETCWLWTGARDPRDYGRFRGEGGKSTLAHRYAYQQIVGPIEPGMQLDHICHVHRCVNPGHLRPATNKQNSEHLLGAYANNQSSGVRNVYWHKAARKWYVSVGHNGRIHYKGLFTDRSDAEAMAIRTRLELFTHNDADHA